MPLKRSLLAVPQRRSVRLGLWYAIAGAMVALDYFTGPVIQFPIAFLLPILLVAWFDSLFHALLLAITLPGIRLSFVIMAWTAPWSVGEAITNAAIRIGVLSLLAYFVWLAAQQHQAALREVQLLERILPICSYCKKIRDAKDSWQPLEVYFHAHADLLFSHGLCPDCARKYYPVNTSNQ